MGAINVAGGVFAVKYKDGILLSTDTLISYGSMRAFKDQERFFQINESTVLASFGEASDYQEIKKLLREKEEEDAIANDGAQFLKTKDYWNYLSRVQYHRRMKMNPLFTNNIVAGVDKASGEKFVGGVDVYGTRNTGDFYATGLGLYYCQVLLQNAHSNDMSQADAIKLLEDCQRILFYRVKRCLDKIQMCKITQEGVEIGQPYRIGSEWSLRDYSEKTNEFFRSMRLKY